MGTYDFKTQPSVVIQGAMDVETEYLIGQLRERECITLGNWMFYTGDRKSTRLNSSHR